MNKYGAKTQNQTPDYLVKDPKPVTIISGTDMLVHEFTTEKLVENLEKKFPKIVKHSFDSTTDTIISFMESALTPSLFSETRLYRIRHADEIKAKELEFIVESLPTLATLSDIFVLIEYKEKVPKELSEFVKSMPQNAVHAVFNSPRYDNEWTGWICEKAKLFFNREIQPDAADKLLDSIGPDTAKIYAELKKIDLTLENKDSKISVSDIEQHVGSLRNVEYGELAAAMLTKNGTKVFDIIELLFSSKARFSFSKEISAIFSYYYKAYRLYLYATVNKSLARSYLSEKNNREKMNYAFKLGSGAGIIPKTAKPTSSYPIIIKPKLIETVRTYRKKDFLHIFKMIMEYDVKIKSGLLTDNKGNFQDLCHRIISIKEIINGKVSAL